MCRSSRRANDWPDTGAALDESPIGYDDRLVLAIDEHDVYGDVPRLFDECRPDGVFCFNDVRAHLAYREADRLGLTVGRDLSVVGVDNQPFIAGILSPALTSVELPHYEMGYWSVRKLISLIERTGDSAMPEPSAVEGASSLLADLNLMLPAGIHAALPSLTQDRRRSRACWWRRTPWPLCRRADPESVRMSFRMRSSE